MSTKNQKLMDAVHAVMRLKHYSIHTERSYCDWVKRFVCVFMEGVHGVSSSLDNLGL